MYYVFGIMYEIECEIIDFERFWQLFGEFLDKNGIFYWYFLILKFGIFRVGKIGVLDQRQSRSSCWIVQFLIFGIVDRMCMGSSVNGSYQCVIVV